MSLVPTLRGHYFRIYSTLFDNLFFLLLALTIKFYKLITQNLIFVFFDISTDIFYSSIMRLRERRGITRISNCMVDHEQNPKSSNLANLNSAAK